LLFSPVAIPPENKKPPHQHPADKSGFSSDSPPAIPNLIIRNKKAAPIGSGPTKTASTHPRFFPLAIS
jgi:hypothetical protein